MTSGDTGVWTPARHPLARLLRDISTGTRPPNDGSWTRVTPWFPSIQGILSFTGHAVLAVSYDHCEDALTDLGVDGYGGALDPRVVTALAGPRGWIDSLDMLFVGLGRQDGSGNSRLVGRSDLDRHPRVAHARRLRQEIQVLGSADAAVHDVVVLARGVAGVREISLELDPARRGQRLGAELVRSALACVPDGELTVACAAPGNVASVKSLLAAGMTPVGAIQVFSDRPEK